MIPRATLRLQFHRDFTFDDAKRHVGWMAGLGISHVYASPITAARPGSTHGYDVIDPAIVNPELGGESAFRAFAATLRESGLGLVIDIVPNHMAADPAANPWWRDVLRRGRSSAHSSWFDVDWEAGGGKVLLPVLGAPLDTVIADGGIALATDWSGAPELRYSDSAFPLAEGSVRDGDDLASLLARQHYRLSCWRTAGDAINWRRFFDINELVCLRMEEPDCFEAVHALPLRLFAEGLVDGLRIDHVDGLTDPAVYCRTLRARLDELSERTGRSRGWLVVEKILLGDEALPRDWGVDGTTGYDFMNEVSALQHDAAAEPVLLRAWEEASGRPADFHMEEERARREILARSFGAQLDACASAWQEVLPHPVPRAALRRLLTELLAHFPVYRTYASRGTLSASDIEILRRASGGARRTCLATDRWTLDLLEAALLQQPAGDPARWQRAMARLQQLSAPVAAKSVEDTAFYRHGAMLSRNDVGFDAGTFSLAPEAFHTRMLARHVEWPNAQLTTATHDHKRGEDVRARLAALSESAQEWAALLPAWLKAIDPLRTEIAGVSAPSDGDITMLLQMIVGAWPPDLAPGDAAGRRAFAERLAGWQEKALREAKLHSDWAAVDRGYEQAARMLLMRLLADGSLPDLLAGLASLADAIAPAGAVNGLAQTLLRHTVPGVPDLYQGCDLWDMSLVDPDNRRPVDYEKRTAAVDASLSDLVASWRDGRVKQRLIRRALHLRMEAPTLFREGAYRPVRVQGHAADRIVAFTRSLGDAWMLVLVPRLIGRELSPGTISLAAGAWPGTELVLDDKPRTVPLHDWLGGGLVEILHDRVKADFLCGTLPLALISTVPPDANC